MEADIGSIRSELESLRRTVDGLVARLRAMESRLNTDRLGSRDRPVSTIVARDGRGNVSEIDISRLMNKG